jgi:tetratricopeptide (TPR) repeat protein
LGSTSATGWCRRYVEAVLCSAKHVELASHDPYAWYEHAIAQLGTGDVTGYRQTCAATLDRFGATKNPDVANRLCYASVPVPDALTDLKRLIPLAEIAAMLGPGNVRILGAVRFRVGDYENAIKCLEGTIKTQPPRAWDWLFLAMAHHRCNNTNQAEACLEKAVRWIDDIKAKDPHGNGLWGWTEQVETQILRDEAERLVKGK